ncbi:MAG: YceI family protein [Burkholderiales bacterium]
MTLRLAALFPLLLLVACQALPPAGNSAVLAKPVAAETSLPIAAPRFAVDASESEIRLLVYRAGPLARFGHNHVVTGPVSGEIRAGESAAESGFRLDVKVASLNVDQASARGEEGSEFAAEVSPQARQGTRANMLGEEVLDAQRYPEIRIVSVALSGPRWNPTVVARTTLRGVTRDLRFSAAVIEDVRRLTIVASFTIRQSDFGITPFVALGGGLRVRDAIEIRIRIVARRESGKGSS